MAEVDGEALSLQECGFVEQVREAVHLDKVLDVLLLAQLHKRYLELAILRGSIADPDHPIAATTEAAATTRNYPEEETGEDGLGEIAAILDSSFKCLSSPI